MTKILEVSALKSFWQILHILSPLVTSLPCYTAAAEREEGAATAHWAVMWVLSDEQGQKVFMVQYNLYFIDTSFRLENSKFSFKTKSFSFCRVQVHSWSILSYSNSNADGLDEVLMLFSLCPQRINFLTLWKGSILTKKMTMPRDKCLIKVHILLMLNLIQHSKINPFVS